MYTCPRHEALENHTSRQLYEASKVAFKYMGNGKFLMIKNRFGSPGEKSVSYRDVNKYLDEASHEVILLSERMTFLDCNFKIVGIHTKLIDRA
ncbi:hypothetical protein [Bacillus phage YungSlug]|nr:hypothetical protein [Bacillus phage YungSlug]